jgi:ribosome-associated protein
VLSKLRVTPDLEIPGSELAWRFSRSSGPGGQSVNTTDSRVELSWDVETSDAVAALPVMLQARLLERLAPQLVAGVLTVTASEHRSQLRNRNAAAVRLSATVREALQPPPRPRRATRPSAGSVRRRLAEKNRRSEVKRGRQKPVD